MIHVILRTCYRSLLTLSRPRICGSDRKEMILKCLHSLVVSCNHSKLELKLTILDDNSDEDIVENIKEKLKLLNSPSEFVSLKVRGFNNSAYEQFYLAAQHDGLVYTVEDDYLHTEDAILEMYNAYNYFKGGVDLKEIAIFPFDCQDRYVQGHEWPCRIFHFNDRFWRTNNHTSNTIFTQGYIFRRYFDLFKTLALNYGKDQNAVEDNTINRIWANLVTSQGNVALFSPIPSLAVHLTYEEPKKITTVMNDWREQWDKIKL
jgi:hypothetical protein